MELQSPMRPKPKNNGKAHQAGHGVIIFILYHAQPRDIIEIVVVAVIAIGKHV
jgi:hypothetical protein